MLTSSVFLSSVLAGLGAGIWCIDRELLLVFNSVVMGIRFMSSVSERVGRGNASNNRWCDSLGLLGRLGSIVCGVGAVFVS